MTANEPNRLAVLDSYDILHSAREKLFDDLVEMAAYIFSVPVVRIAFVHRQEVWHKASVGMPAQEVLSPEQTLCARAIHSHKPVLVYSDLLAGPPLDIDPEQGPPIRFYAAVPLRTVHGFSIGTVCLAGYEPREFTVSEQRLLTQLAWLVMLALEARLRLLDMQGPAAWEQLRQEAEEALHSQLAVVRYLKTRSAGQVPVPDELLETIGRRLKELADVLMVG